MYSLLLAIIYLSFISLGLPDSLLGSAWPTMYGELGVPLSYAGIISMIIAGGTVISSLLSDRLTKHMGTAVVTACSVGMTALALFGFSNSNSFAALCLFAVPYGLGAGAVDAALNNYVALHYSSRHMSWLHCFWGVGCSVGPYIMGFCLTGGLGWNMGYRTVSIIQIVLTAVLFMSLPLWKKQAVQKDENKEPAASIGIVKALKIKGVALVLFSFFAYSALETTSGLWAASYLVGYCNIDSATAANFASFFYLGITAGRFLCGFVADKFGDKRMIRIGVVTTIFGVILIGLSFVSSVFAFIGLIIVGFGCAPIYPSIIHSTPSNFGKQNSQSIIGIQMASAYIGSTFMPPVFGMISGSFSIGLFPIFLLVFGLIMLIMTEKLNKSIAVKQ